jgi:hypothetical protein
MLNFKGEKKMNKYKIVPYDVVNDMYLLKKRILLIFWFTIGFGKKEKILKTLKEIDK